MLLYKLYDIIIYLKKLKFFYIIIFLYISKEPMESRIIYHVEKFVAFLFGGENPYDFEQRIYNKLLRLDGEELEVWMNEILKKYITGQVTYQDFRGDKLEVIDGQIKFKTWYQYHIGIESTDVMCVEEICGNNFEDYQELKSTIPKYQHRYPSSQIEFIESYFEKYIMEKSSDELKSYIIQLVDPVEIK